MDAQIRTAWSLRRRQSLGSVHGRGSGACRIGAVVDREAGLKSKPQEARASKGPVGDFRCPPLRWKSTEGGCSQRGTVASGWELRPGSKLTIGMSPQCHQGSWHEPGGAQLGPAGPGTLYLVVFGFFLEVSKGLVFVMRIA